MSSNSTINQSLAEEMPHFIEEMALWFQPRTEAAKGNMELVVATYCRELGIRDKAGLRHLSQVIINNHKQLRLPTVGECREMLAHEAERRRGGKSATIAIERGTPEWDAWQEFYRGTPREWAIPRMEQAGVWQVPSLLPPVARAGGKEKGGAA